MSCILLYLQYKVYKHYCIILYNNLQLKYRAERYIHLKQMIKPIMQEQYAEADKLYAVAVSLSKFNLNGLEDIKTRKMCFC